MQARGTKQRELVQETPWELPWIESGSLVRDVWSAVEYGGIPEFLGRVKTRGHALNSLQKEVFWYTRIHSLLINGVVTASSHALWRVLSNKVIRVLGHIQICRLWVRHSPCCTLFLINCFVIEMVLCDLYLKRFDLTKGLLFDTFSITVWYKLRRYDHSVLVLESFSPPMNW